VLSTNDCSKKTHCPLNQIFTVIHNPGAEDQVKKIFHFKNKKNDSSGLSFPSGPEPLSEFKTKNDLCSGDNSILTLF